MLVFLPFAEGRLLALVSIGGSDQCMKLGKRKCALLDLWQWMMGNEEHKNLESSRRDW